MNPPEELEDRLRRLGSAVAPDPSILDAVMRRIERAARAATPSNRTRRILSMIARQGKPITAAAILIMAAVLVTHVVTSSKEAYALEQTVEALKGVRYMHVVRRDKKGQIEDERWIEVGPDGFQTRYRQENRDVNFLVVDDGKTCLVHHRDKKTVVLYDRKEKQYQWFGNLGKLLREVAGKGAPGSVEIEENVRKRGRRAHRVRLVVLDITCYIDPRTKLPFAVGDSDVTYEEPPKGTFDIVVPKGVTVVDRRPGAPPSEEPEWMKEEAAASKQFDPARRALANGDYQQAAALLKEVVAAQPGRNWAHYWLGCAHYQLGDYDAAIACFCRVVKMFGEYRWSVPYCHLARGFAYAKKGMMKEAEQDIAAALPKMIEALSSVHAAQMFDYAYDPLYRDGRRVGKAASRRRTIGWLRAVTGQNFGYDPAATPQQNQEALAAWQKWLKSSDLDKAIRVDLNADLRLVRPPVPPLSPEIAAVKKRITDLPSRGAGKQALDLLKEARRAKLADHRLWFKLGMTLYEAKRYPEALEAFRLTERSQEDHFPHYFLAVVWQGHMLDLLGRRREALERYRKALEKDSGRTVRHDQYGLRIDRKWIEERLKTPFERVEWLPGRGDR